MGIGRSATARPARRHRGDGRAHCPRPTEAPDVEETGATLEENARIKARGARRRARAARDRRRHRARGRRARRRARRVLGARTRGEHATVRRQRRQAARRARRRAPAPRHRAVRDGGDGALGPTAASSRSRGEVEGAIAAAAAWCRRLRLRPGVRAGRRGRPHVCGDERRPRNMHSRTAGARSERSRKRWSSRRREVPLHPSAEAILPLFGRSAWISARTRRRHRCGPR